MKNILTKTIILIFFTAIVFEGCVSLSQKKFESISFYKSNEYNNTRVQRVLLTPFTYETSREKVIKEVTEAFFVVLQKSVKFETVLPRAFRDITLQQNDLWDKGIVKAETIIEAKKIFKVDAIIFGTITQYNPYEPQVLGVKVSMFSTTSGRVIWSSDAIFDSSESSVVQLVKNYYKDNFQKKQSLFDWKMILLSTKRYAQFVAHNIIATL
ncbi:MAG: hypothetical protein ACE5KZ_01775 [Candidatus Scalinduaceae bacterium]